MKNLIEGIQIESKLASVFTSSHFSHGHGFDKRSQAANTWKSHDRMCTRVTHTSGAQEVRDVTSTDAFDDQA